MTAPSGSFLRLRSIGLAVVAVATVLAVAAVVTTAVLGGRQSPPPMLRYDPSALTATVPTSAVAAAPAQQAQGGLDPSWVATVTAATSIPPPAVRAYALASLAVDAEDTSCHLGWTTLAGIGEIESQHGTIGGRTLLDNGLSTTAIVGPALDGHDGVAAIPARVAETPGATTSWDHAYRPLQFIPSTWATWGSDGDHDGAVDINDINDAAYAAGRYLCADGHDLATGDGWSAAVLSYNHSSSYLASVYDAAVAYAARTGR